MTLLMHKSGKCGDKIVLSVNQPLIEFGRVIVIGVVIAFLVMMTSEK